MHEDCGECKNCVDKPKFGGRGIKKQACEKRACCNPQEKMKESPLVKAAKAEQALLWSCSTLVLPQPAPQGSLTEVVVPAGVLPGQQIKFVRPGGGWIMVTVPPGVFAGQKFRVKLPAATGPPLKAAKAGSFQEEGQKSEESDESEGGEETDGEESFQALLSIFQGRLASKGQEREGQESTCQYRGVSGQNGRWRARIWQNGGDIVIGVFDNAVAAALAYDEKALQLLGPRARLNFPSGYAEGRTSPTLAAAPATPAMGVAATATPAKGVAKQVKVPCTDEEAEGAETKSHSSQYRGVSGRNSRWRARIWHNGGDIIIGIFDNEVAAALAYDEKAREMHGPEALVNFPRGTMPTSAAAMKAAAATAAAAAAAAKPPLPARMGGGRWEAKVYWTHEEDLKVLDGVSRYGQNWARIARDLSRSHTDDAVRHRWHRLMSTAPSPSPLVKAAANKNVLEHGVTLAITSPEPDASPLSATTQEPFDGQTVTCAGALRQLDGESSTTAGPLGRDKRASAIQAWRPQPEAKEPIAPKAKKAKLDPSRAHPIPGARTEVVGAFQDEESEAKAKKAKPHSPAFKLRLVRSAQALPLIFTPTSDSPLTTGQVREALLLPPENRIKPTCRRYPTVEPCQLRKRAPHVKGAIFRRAWPALCAHASPSPRANLSRPALV